MVVTRAAAPKNRSKRQLKRKNETLAYYFGDPNRAHLVSQMFSQLGPKGKLSTYYALIGLIQDPAHLSDILNQPAQVRVVSSGRKASQYSLRTPTPESAEYLHRKLGELATQFDIREGVSGKVSISELLYRIAERVPLLE